MGPGSEGSGRARRARTAAGTVVTLVGDWITDGRLQPGDKVSETRVAAESGVSRNTVREAFRLLEHDRLLVHEPNRGVFVPRVGPLDVRDIYRVRRVLEPAVVRALTTLDVPRMQPLADAVAEARAAAARADWPHTGTSNMRFHRSLVGLAGSARLDATMRRLMAELRLVFAVVEHPAELFGPFVERNALIADLLMATRFPEAAATLETYLTDSEDAILAAFARQELTA
ncbi:GntR family transcriptional regulator [Ornithinimicrobium sp. W1665]|uniref:GntR family transcriptional regulator n=1 Tax=Ornithinimicrobium sp. W1665 TaxID=3416666 RepID=UPI003CF01CD7